MKTLNVIDWEKAGSVLFCTLTYPDEVFFEHQHERSIHRHLFVRYLEKHLKRKVAIIWRIEWMPRKSGSLVGLLVPHYHLLILGVGFVPHEKVREWWAKALQHDGPIATDIRKLTGVQAAIRYVAKYVAKELSLDIVPYLSNGIELGRHWGILRKPLVPMCPVVCQRELTTAEVERARLQAANVLRHYDTVYGQGFVLLGNQALENFRRLLGIGIDEMPEVDIESVHQGGE
jgi:hypothetical protein